MERVQAAPRLYNLARPWQFCATVVTILGYFYKAAACLGRDLIHLLVWVLSRRIPQLNRRLAKHAENDLLKLALDPQLVIAYDNFNFKDTVRNQSIGHFAIMQNLTSALAVLPPYLPSIGLKHSLSLTMAVGGPCPPRLSLDPLRDQILRPLYADRLLSRCWLKWLERETSTLTGLWNTIYICFGLCGVRLVIQYVAAPFCDRTFSALNVTLCFRKRIQRIEEIYPDSPVSFCILKMKLEIPF
ncbi:hypothetical protein V8E54_005665 [Elaphomyces granulatus]